MKLHIYMPILLLVLLGVNANQQKAHAEPQPILWDELARVINGIEVNYLRPYLWIRYSITTTPNGPAETRYCYKMDVRQRPYRTYGWVSTYNYVLNGWTQAYGTMIDAETAWCWQ
jgi:hypothetical protein